MRLSGFVSALLLAGLLSAPLVRAQAPPDAATIAGLIAKMSEAALAFDKNLPDFICTQTTKREIRLEPELNLGVHISGGRGGGSSNAMMTPGRSGTWERTDSYDHQLTYFGHQETYLLTKVNGKPAKKSQTPPPGLESAGEFGSTLFHIFEKESKTAFEWKKYDTIRGTPVDVISFSILKENSAVQMIIPAQTIVVAYHGDLWVERETGMVLRLTTFADSPPDFPLRDVSHSLDYGRTEISGQKYLVPLHSEMLTTASEEFMKSGRPSTTGKMATMRNTVDFSSYRKYGAESTLKVE